MIDRQQTQPIAAIATAQGRGSIGVVRISGSNLAGFLEALIGCTNKKLAVRTANYLTITDETGSVIDNAIVIYFEGPHSFTGEDVVEIQGHGGTAVMQLLLQRCLSVGKSIGLRLAEPGEFSLRAYLNDKIDLAQAEAIADLIDASSSAAAKAAAASLSGAFSEEVNKLSDSIVHVRTLVEATLDFPEEEIEFIEKYQVKALLKRIDEQLQQVLDVSRQSSYLKEGLKVVLAGQPNVGKSSLLNAIFEQDIAIVTDIAGTTRDRIRESITIDGVPILLTDTAGLRDTNDTIEKIGIERSWQAIEDADLILDVVDCRDPVSLLSKLTSNERLVKCDILKVLNKSDLLDSNSRHLTELRNNSIWVSAKTGQGIPELKRIILSFAGRQIGEVSPWLGRVRHISALEVAQQHLQQALEHAQFDDRVLDLLAEELRLSHEALGSITGAMSADDLLGEIFSSFCIGK